MQIVGTRMKEEKQLKKYLVILKVLIIKAAIYTRL